jgi:hypothetical protein
MTPHPQTHPRPAAPRRRTASLLISLLLAGIAVAGCNAGPARGQATQPTQPATAPQPTNGSPAPLGDCAQALPGLGHTAEGAGSQRFEITRQQLTVIGSRLVEVFCRQGLWQQDVGFGVHDEKDPTRVLVLISPGHSGLTAKQILDRLLGRA